LDSSLRYNPTLDGLRAVAAMLVVADHCRVPGFNPGYFGVDLFFVLSGFLITRLLVDELDSQDRIDLPRFYLRRFLRLAPPLLLLLAAYLALAPMAWPQFSFNEHLRDAGLTGFYLSDYAMAFWHYPKALQHSWSLSVEQRFYFIWPFAVLLLARTEPRWRIAGLFGIYLLATAWRIFEYGHAGWTATYFRFDTRMSGLIVGALLAMWLPRMGRISERTANIVGILGCAALVICLSIGHWRGPWSLVWLTSLAEMAAVGLLISASVQSSWVSTTLSARPLVAVGIISYGVYLWHYPVAVYFRGFLPWYQTLPITLILTFATATASYLAVERPLQRFRRNLRPHRLEVGAAAERDDHDSGSVTAAPQLPFLEARATVTRVKRRPPRPAHLRAS
jgi:peptidoglycan/LPS O-acetylase OafA/YrhL